MKKLFALFFILITNVFSIMASDHVKMETTESPRTGFLCNGDCCIPYTIRPCEMSKDQEKLSALIPAANQVNLVAIMHKDLKDYFDHKTIVQEFNTFTQDGKPAPKLIATNSLFADVLSLENKIVGAICYFTVARIQAEDRFTSGRIQFIFVAPEYRAKAIPVLVEHAFSKIMTTKPNFISAGIGENETALSDIFRRLNFDVIKDGASKGVLVCNWFRRETQADRKFAEETLDELGEIPVADESFVIHATPENLEALISAQKTPIILDICAEWCFPCLRLKPIIAELAQENQGRYAFITFNYDDAKKCPFAMNLLRVAQERGIEGIPALFFISNGKVKGADVGFLKKTSFQEKIAHYFR